jgi:PAS domain S-box-containing protein
MLNRLSYLLHSLKKWYSPIVCWLEANTFTPSLLQRWGKLGYLTAILSQIIAIAINLMLIHLFPDFHFRGATYMLTVLLIALGWGLGPCLTAILLGTLLNVVLLPPTFSLTLEKLVAVSLDMIVGLIFGILLSQTQRARRQAEALIRQLSTIIEAIPDPLVLYDRKNHPTYYNKRALGIIVSDPQKAFEEQFPLFEIRNMSGEPIRFNDLPGVRALRGETVTDFEIVYRTLQDQHDCFAAITAAPVRAASSSAIEGAVVIFRDLSALRQTERRAAERASQLEVIFSSLTDAVRVYDLQGRIIQQNPAARRLLTQLAPDGADKLSMEQRNASIPFFQEDGTPIAPDQVPMARILRGEILTSEHSSIFQCCTRDGQRRWFSVSGAPIRDAQGHITGSVAIMRDVTERQQLIQRLKEAEHEAEARAQQLETTFESITDGLVILDAHGKSVRMNRACRDMLAMQEGVAYASDYDLPFEVLDEQGHALPREQWPDMRLRHGESITGNSAIDILLRRRGGQQVRQVSITGTSIRDAQGQIVSQVLACRDVTERRALEQRTRKSLEALLQMAQSMVQRPDATTVPSNSQSQQEHITCSVERRLAELTCEVLGCQCLSLIMVEPETEALRPLAVAGLSSAQERLWWEKCEGKLGTLSNSPLPEMVERLRRGEMVQLNTAYTPWYEPYTCDTHYIFVAPLSLKSQLLGLLILDYGKHEWKHSDEELALIRAAAQFAVLSLERERLLLESAEAYANMLALQETNRLLDEFIGIASHELRTPLTAMKVSVQLAQQQAQRLLRPQDASQERCAAWLHRLKDLLELVNSQVNRQNSLVNDLLDVASIRAGKVEMHIEPYDIGDLVQEIVQEQQSIQPNRTLSLNIAIPAGTLVLADAGRVRQVLHNYLSNALKYSEPDKPVEVGVEQREQQAGAPAYVWVRDYGPGLTPTQQEHLWERFYRVPEITVKSGSGVGLGLGLYISRIMIEQQGGQVGIHSSSAGSTFWFTLPLYPPN